MYDAGDPGKTWVLPPGRSNVRKGVRPWVSVRVARAPCCSRTRTAARLRLAAAMCSGAPPEYSRHASLMFTPVTPGEREVTCYCCMTTF